MEDTMIQPHVSRMKSELVELDDKLEKLGDFLKTSVFLSLSEDDRNDMAEQFLHMGSYANVLSRRIDRSLAN